MEGVCRPNRSCLLSHPRLFLWSRLSHGGEAMTYHPIDRLRPRDYLPLAASSTALFLPGVLPPGPLCAHWPVVPQPSREMLARHDWLVPTAGGEPWLERPPLSAWVIAAADAA